MIHIFATTQCRAQRQQLCFYKGWPSLEYMTSSGAHEFKTLFEIMLTSGKYLSLKFLNSRIKNPSNDIHRCHRTDWTLIKESSYNFKFCDVTWNYLYVYGYYLCHVCYRCPLLSCSHTFIVISPNDKNAIWYFKQLHNKHCVHKRFSVCWRNFCWWNLRQDCRHYRVIS
jgi:hypothetical protein